jgi:hypothetical protein
VRERAVAVTAVAALAVAVVAGFGAAQGTIAAAPFDQTRCRAAVAAGSVAVVALLAELDATVAAASLTRAPFDLDDATGAGDARSDFLVRSAGPTLPSSSNLISRWSLGVGNW